MRLSLVSKLSPNRTQRQHCSGEDDINLFHSGLFLAAEALEQKQARTQNNVVVRLSFIPAVLQTGAKGEIIFKSTN